MLIYICCCGGATSSFFCSKIKKEAEKENVLVEALPTILQDWNNIKDKHTLILAYGSVSFISSANIRDYHLDDIIDHVLIAPQARYMKKTVKDLMDPLGIETEIIDMKTFGMMDGKKVLNDIHTMLDNLV